jgi:hypothetical protein
LEEGHALYALATDGGRCSIGRHVLLMELPSAVPRRNVLVPRGRSQRVPGQWAGSADAPMVSVCNGFNFWKTD